MDIYLYLSNYLVILHILYEYQVLPLLGTTLLSIWQAATQPNMQQNWFKAGHLTLYILTRI